MTEVLQINRDDLYDVMGAAMNVINTLGHGFAEKVYENALAVEFSQKNISFLKQPEFEVTYKGIVIGHYIPDFIVNADTIVEIKTISAIGQNEIGQVLNYLKATNLKTGLILNFKNPKLEWKRVSL
jgi:GxxExxY protein